MSIETTMTSDVVGLTKVAPVSRRGFMSATAAVAAGYTLAAGPVRAEVITTDTNGLTGRRRQDQGRPTARCPAISPGPPASPSRR